MHPTQDLLQLRINTYLKSTWYARWITIAIVAASFWFIPEAQRGVIEVLSSVAITYNILVFLSEPLHLRLLANRVFIILADGIMAVALVAYSGFSESPYLFILVFMVVSSAFWYGLRGVIATAVLQASGFALLEYTQHMTPIPKLLVIQTLILITIGLYVSWLTNHERLERNQLFKINTETEKERQQLSALINSVRDSVLVLDNHDRIAISNQAATLLLGGKTKLKGKLFHEQVQFVDSEGQPADFKIKHSTTPLRKDARIRAADNSLVNVEISVAPYIVDRQNRGTVVILHDNSDDKAAAQEREEFIAVASHELRTPLTIAESDISILMTPPYLPENKESVAMLNGALRSLTQLSHIISDLTNLSQVRDEKLEIELEPLNPMGLLREFHADYIDQAKAKGLELSVVTNQSVDAPTIMTSRYVVQEILTIFVSNAVKFTEEGTITLALVPSEEKGGITFSVHDTGIGISQSDKKKIFEEFFQSEHYTNRIHGGTGLGLYIAKQLATRITAKIWFDSELGKGSTFFLWVPPYSKNSQDRQKVAQAETKDFFDKV